MSPQPYTVFITGANRGIGRALAEAYLSRPNHNVIASVRNPEGTTLKAFQPAEGSRLLVVKIEATSASDPAAAIETIKAAGITALDVVIAVTGINPTSAFAEVKDMDPAKLEELFQVNTFSFVKLFSATHPLLKAAADNAAARAGTPKLVAISSFVGQLVEMQSNIPLQVGAYGASKAALNYLVRRAHFENPWLACWVMNPGFVQTDNGNACAELWGMGQAPDALKDVVPAMMARIDEATPEKSSGKFYNFDGTELTY
ncbi:uncharacterized protein PG998_012882 [Apiospora kogelbergensis]|uniref:uncharacterized protein n=1 Tax=Apiospora kogelbergensis TaxID=1337665 RepID=UPI0031328F95